jgi:hypothetical protein
LNATDCKPHKSLRTTIKVFLTTLEKKAQIAKAAAAPVEKSEEAPTSITDSKNTPGEVHNITKAKSDDNEATEADSVSEQSKLNLLTLKVVPNTPLEPEHSVELEALVGQDAESTPALVSEVIKEDSAPILQSTSGPAIQYAQMTMPNVMGNNMMWGMNGAFDPMMMQAMQVGWMGFPSGMGKFFNYQNSLTTKI